ncbi:ORF6N domain-containing protein [Halopseudomonas nanhaiensis]|uniref:ORF6N domain-containing protein n=1 Tax=Halopseudomonas nanhaiensis TaxID=2830842 RepID=UPI001CBEE23B|nr:ORF6N domain-containing protein [Halopseudomonas nanhaiensis]UAW97254.1 ORF6N domain-containing protein [Halopseudomonas nanhaiensis]
MTAPSFIRYANTDTLSLRQLDELNGVPKGTSFRAFKACREELVEGEDYFLLQADRHEGLINELKAANCTYATTVNLILLTRAGYQRMRAGSGKRP